MAKTRVSECPSSVRKSWQRTNGFSLKLRKFNAAPFKIKNRGRGKMGTACRLKC